MVKGLEKFREYFEEFKDNYVIIGGTACDIALSETDMRPRATDDIDMILIMEEMTPAFGARFWQFIADGHYAHRQRQRAGHQGSVPELFRFIKPDAGFPIQIELLSAYPDILGEPTGFHLAPIPLGEKLSSLSAIIMDSDYYQFTLENSTIENGLRVATPLCLICLKTRAFLNLTEDKKTNSDVRSFDIKKHRDDVFKLLAMRIDPFTPIVLPMRLKNCIRQFTEVIETSLPNQSLQDGLHVTNEQIRGYLDLMKEIFDL